jgi:WD40-like Beta Propeller Repeat
MKSRLTAFLLIVLMVVGALALIPGGAQAAVGDLLLASSTSGGAAALASCDAPVISSNGRYVAFTSQATNLPGYNSNLQVYRKDLATGAIVLASATAGGVAGDNFSGYPSISDDGRYIAFESFASNFQGSGTNWQVYRKDMSTGTLALASSTDAGEPGSAGSELPSMSANGRYLVFHSTSVNFPGQNGQSQVYRKDMSTNSLVLASSTQAGLAGLSYSYRSTISADGRYTAFVSNSSNFPGQNGQNQIYRKDLTGGTLLLASSMDGGSVGSSWSDSPCLSPGGRYAVFQSNSGNFPGAGGSLTQVYRKDLSGGALELVSSTTAGVAGLSNSSNSSRAVTYDGRYVTFVSTSANFPGTSPVLSQVFRKDMSTGTLELVSCTAGGVPGSEGSGPGSTGPEAISSGGRFVAFVSDSDNFPGSNHQQQIYRKEMATENAAWYLAEGTTAWGFSTYITIENPNDSDATARVDYMPTGLANKSETVPLPARSQTTLTNDHLVQVMGAQADFSTKVTCLEGMPIAADRTMEWTGEGAGSPEAHSSIGVAAPAKNWYMPEGSTKWGFECWLCIQNPNGSKATCQVTYMIEGEGPQTFTKEIDANKRDTFNMADDIGEKDASIKVSSNVPVIPERSMYRNNRREGHESIGTTQTATSYYLAEGTTNYGFTTYVCIQNPNDTDVQVNLTYMTEAGPVPHPGNPVPMGANSRKTIRVNDFLPDADFSTRVDCAKPIITERAMYWYGGPDNAEACHDSIGMSEPHYKFYLPDGQTSGGRETYMCVQNPAAGDGPVRITYLKAGGGAPVVFEDTIPGYSRKTYNLADKGINGRASVLVESLHGVRKYMVERVMYWNSRGAGTATIGGYSDAF